MPFAWIRRVVRSAPALVVATLVVGGLSACSTAEPRPTPLLTSVPPTPSALNDRFGFVWVDERSMQLHVRPETGLVGFDLVARSYGVSRCSCAVSPDGTQIVYWTDIAPGVELRVVQVARPIPQVTTYRAPDDQRISSAVWSSDGTGILFALEGVDTSGGPPGAVPNSSLLVIEASGGTARALVQNTRGGPIYVPLGWDRTAGVAAAGKTGPDGCMTGYLSQRTAGDPAPKETTILEELIVLSVDASADQRFVLGVFSDTSESTLRWWGLDDFGRVQSGPSVDRLVSVKWRPLSSEVGWIEGGVLHLLDVERGTKRTVGTLPSADYWVAAFRRDGSAVAAGSLSGPATLLEIASGRTETINPGSIVSAVRFR